MKIFYNYLVGYIFLFLVARFGLSHMHPLISFSISFAIFFLVWFYELKRFQVYMEQYHKDVLVEYKRRYISGQIWIKKYIRKNSKRSETGDPILSKNCRRIRILSVCSFPAFIVLICAGLPW